MNLWNRFEKRRNINKINKGFEIHFEKGIDPGLRKFFLYFVKWLRKNYCFPVHFNIYIKNAEKIKLLDGTMAYGGFRYFEERNPYIRIPAKIEDDLLMKYILQENYEMVLSSLVHEITHYFQWVSNIDLSERQADYYRYRIIEQFENELEKVPEVF